MKNNKQKLLKGNKVISLILAIVIILTTLFSTFAASVSAASITPTPKASPAPTLTPEQAEAKESVLKGFSKFEYKNYEWPESLTVGKLSIKIAEKIYNIRGNKQKKPKYWTNSETEGEMKDFYSSTNWHNFSGMLESVEISNLCKAILTEEVAAYEELMDRAATYYGFSAYKEIFKAIAQARFNEYKDDYNNAKQKGLINNTGDDLFDLFHIDGSWIDGGKTPVGDVKTISPTPTSIPISAAPNSTPTPMPTGVKPPTETSMFTVSESINYAADAFSRILNDAVFPSPYNTDGLLPVVQSFEFGGDSDSIKQQYSKSSVKLEGFPNFISFEQFHSVEKARMEEYNQNKDSENGEDEEIDHDKIIEKYAAVIANKATRTSQADEYGKYKYSDQKFYEKVFANYQCSGGGSMDYGQMPEEMKQILRECMKTWDSRVTKERREIIQQGVLLYGVEYSMASDKRNNPSIEHPKYLDCSAFVGQCYWRAGVMDSGTVHWPTGEFARHFQEIPESELIPGDIAQKTWTPGGFGPDEHIGIYIGSIGGTKYYIHCTGSQAVVIDSYSGFVHFGRKPGFK